ncbi:MAG TPA: hypothetical protein VFA03_16190 [Acetobacteraceae bacterium]|nr:hypothetical protein [Acetobacteraceae bacterium]
MRKFTASFALALMLLGVALGAGRAVAADPYPWTQPNAGGGAG